MCVDWISIIAGEGAVVQYEQGLNLWTSALYLMAVMIIPLIIRSFHRQPNEPKRLCDVYWPSLDVWAISYTEYIIEQLMLKCSIECYCIEDAF